MFEAILGCLSNGFRLKQSTVPNVKLENGLSNAFPSNTYMNWKHNLSVVLEVVIALAHRQLFDRSAFAGQSSS